MFLDLYLAGMLHLFGAVIFKRFEERTPMRKSLRKLVFIHGVTALLAFTVGRPWTLIWIFGMFGLGLIFHFWWTRKHHIHPVTAEPRAEYYALRGMAIMNDTIFHTTFVIVLLAFTVLRGYYHSKSVQARGEAEYKEGRGHQLIRFLIGFPLMLTLFGYMFNPALLGWAQFSLPAVLQWLGVVLGVLSIGLLIWVHEALGANFSRTLHIRAEHTLVTVGPYRYARHPMYTMLFLLGLATLLLTANWLVGGFFLISFFSVVIKRLANEEAAMIEKFGDAYQDYMRRTKRFIPGLI